MATRSTKTAAKTPKAATKPAKAKTTAPVKSAPVAPTATVVEAMKPVVAGAPVKKPELIERVMTETGMKKKDVKPVVEAMLTVLGRALSDGEELVVPPLGKVMVKRAKDLPNARIMNIKLRHPTGDKTAPKDPLAQAAE